MHWSLLFGLIVVVLATVEAKTSKNPRPEDTKLKIPTLKGLDEEWKAFKLKYKKTYKSAAEETLRKKIFAENLVKIKAHNSNYAKGQTGFTMGINPISDMETSEVVKFMTGYRGGKSLEKSHSSKFFVPNGNASVPDEIDWRSKGYVTPVKEQEQCGSCWAFSTTGTLEGQHFRKTGNLVSLSEQQLVDCDTEDLGCNGGWPYRAIGYISSNEGIDTEDSYPYNGVQGAYCGFTPSTIGATCTGYVNVAQSESALKAAVAEIGPISIAIDASQPSFQSYSGGVYNEPNCTTIPDHAVLVVGYGKNNKGEEYWIVKNSWGDQWGMDGYILMSRNKNNQCGISGNAVYPEV